MTRTLSVSLVTLGDPDTLTGGYLYHRRMQEFAPANGARLELVSLPARPFPLPSEYLPRRYKRISRPFDRSPFLRRRVLHPGSP